MNALSKLAAACALALLFATPAFAQLWTENGDAGDVIATAQETFGTGPLTGINGDLQTPNDVDLFCIRLTSVPPAGSPFVQLNCVVNGGPNVYLFDASGNGVFVNETCQAGEKTLLAPNVSLAPGTYYVGVAFSGIAAQSAAGSIWLSGFPGQRAPDGPGAAQPLIGWAGAPIVQPLNPYHLTLNFMGYCGAPVPAKRQTWGSVKAHYR